MASGILSWHRLEVEYRATHSTRLSPMWTRAEPGISQPNASIKMLFVNPEIGMDIVHHPYLQNTGFVQCITIKQQSNHFTDKTVCMFCFNYYLRSHQLEVTPHKKVPWKASQAIENDGASFKCQLPEVLEFLTALCRTKKVWVTPAI